MGGCISKEGSPVVEHSLAAGKDADLSQLEVGSSVFMPSSDRVHHASRRDHESLPVVGLGVYNTEI